MPLEKLEEGMRETRTAWVNIARGFEDLGDCVWADSCVHAGKDWDEERVEILCHGYFSLS